MTFDPDTRGTSDPSLDSAGTGRAHLLITDDRPEVMAMVEGALGKRYDCSFSSSLEEAREQLAGDAFQAAICDLQTSKEAGLTQVEEIVRDYPTTAIILITDVDDPEVTERTFQLGAHGYLVKPFWPGQLLITVKNALRQRELELALQAESLAIEQRSQLLSDMAPVPIYIKDTDRRYVVANKVAHELAGVEPGTLVGLTDRDFMPPEAERIAAEGDREVLEGRTFEKVETMSVAGETRTFLNLKFPLANEAGEISGITGISTDITSKRLVESLRNELTSTEAEALTELRASRQETVERLALAIETHDRETGVHVARMAAITALLGTKLGIDEDRILLLRAAAPMHDVGKIATPDAILQKAGPLTGAERKVMERHTVVGHQILADSKSELLQIAAMIALTHHERWDGYGYPQGLRGEDIPTEGRIVAVADVFDALISDRCYRSAMPVADAVALIRAGRGTQFDPLIADALLDNVEEILALRAVETSEFGVILPTPSVKIEAAAPGEVATDGPTPSIKRLRDRLFLRHGGDHESPEELRDRRKAPEDRRQSVRDRESATHELACEGTDSLTGVMRRRVGLAAIQRELDRAERIGEPLVVAFVDAIGLKQVNDTRGHLAGDKILEDIAACITDDLRSYDVVTRVGGDEFICALPGQNAAEAAIRFRQISGRLADRASGARMTVGLAARQRADTLNQLIDRADQAMLKARREQGIPPRD
jgi:diguanylate cyclase (GGDEF)-like protein/PAS domain S-box-containing protein